MSSCRPRHRPSTWLPTPLTERLNRVLSDGSENALRQLFAAPRPFRIEWSFQGRDLVSGEAVPVSVEGADEPGAISVRFEPEDPARFGLSVSFPNSYPGIFEVVANATMTDPFSGEPVHARVAWLGPGTDT